MGHERPHRDTNLFAVVRDGLQDRTQRLETDGDVQQVRRVEEVVEVAENREREVPSDVQERLNNTRNYYYYYYYYKCIDLSDTVTQ